MKGDFTKFLFDPENHYTRVLKQQGRVDLDSDWNEQAEIQEALRELQARDIIGRCGAAVPGVVLSGGGFEIVVINNGNDLSISAGRIYVDGIACELEKSATYLNQPDYPKPIPGQLNPSAGRTDMVYLDVWRRHLTANEAPEIREVALDGPDTTTRVQTVRQVKVKPGIEATTCEGALAELPQASGGRLTTGQKKAGDEADPCLIAPEAGFRGVENRLYRVEIHDGSSPGPATFKWSRDNGAVAYGIVEQDKSNKKLLRLERLGRDQTLAIRLDDWVEVLDDVMELHGQPGLLAKVADVNRSKNTITLETNEIVPTLDSTRHPRVRRWDQGSDAVPVTTEPDFVELEDGVQIRFSGSDFRTGDYWVFTARTASGEVEKLTEAPPHGIEHRYCPLALITWNAARSESPAKVEDCRKLYPYLTELTGFFYLGGDGQEAMPEETLCKSLRVGVAHDRWPVKGAPVRFQAGPGNGTLSTSSPVPAAGGSSTLEVRTNTEGVASVFWRPNAKGDHCQEVWAELLEVRTNGKRLHLPIRFSANLSTADHVYYDSKNCDYQKHKEATTVQEAIDALCPPVRFVPLGGDGQTGCAGEKLPQPLRVGAFWGKQTLVGSKVEFRVLSGGGSVEDSSADVSEKGVAETSWTLGEDPLRNAEQRVVASLLEPPGMRTVPEIHFTAHLTNAKCVYLDREVCPPATTVAEALEKLCSREEEPGIHIVNVITASDERPLLNDSELIGLERLAKGIQVICGPEGLPVEKLTLGRKPTCFVSLEYPVFVGAQPAAAAETIDTAKIQKAAVQAYVLAILEATVDVDAAGNVISWKPQRQALQFLESELDRVRNLESIRENLLLLHLTLKGNFIWAMKRNQQLYLDGEAYGKLANRQTVLDLDHGSGDGRRGGDFEMWFWLKAPAVPNIAVDPSVLTFGNVVRGRQKSLNFTVKNTGDATLAIQKRALQTGTHFNVQPLPITPIVSPGGEMVLTASFSPQIADKLEDVVGLESNDPDTPILSVLLKGTGIENNVGTVRGTVRDASGAVVPDVSVTLALAEAGPPGRRHATTTNAGGQYELLDIPAGGYVVEAGSAVFGNVSKDAIVRANRETEVNLDFPRARVAFGQIRGTVFGNVPVPGTNLTKTRRLEGAQVSLQNTQTGLTREFTTNAAGEYASANLPVGVYDIVASAQDFKDGVERAVVLQSGENKMQNFVLDPSGGGFTFPDVRGVFRPGGGGIRRIG